MKFLSVKMENGLHNLNHMAICPGLARVHHHGPMKTDVSMGINGIVMIIVNVTLVTTALVTVLVTVL